MKIPKWSVIPLATLLIMLGIVAIMLTSGCITNDFATASNKFLCESINGGIWIEQYGECCEKGCPIDPPSAPYTAAEQALVDKCSVCWMP